MDRFTGITMVVPCSGAKLDHAAPARELYTGTMTQHTLAAALHEVAQLDQPARVLILSALHGLVELDQVLEPYEMKMGAPGCVTVERLREQALALGMGWGPGELFEDVPGEVYSMMPRAYYRVLYEALVEIDVWPHDVYSECKGILQQKRVNVNVRKPIGEQAEETPAEAPARGPQMWIGGDVAALWWGERILVSYGRLREAVELPSATAPWVLDSRGFNEIKDYAGWTITAEQYAADVARYDREIGHLQWVLPQDWPARAALLARTGLTEHEHQVRTTASVKELRRLITDKIGVPVLAVLTADTPEGYLRHLAMYRAEGIDLTSELVAVGALVGRKPSEAATIIRMLHAAGVTRMHGLGIKGVVLDMVGPLLESVDSASWSAENRRRGGRCPHPDSGVTWERNCPHAARAWGAAQAARAADVPVQLILPIPA